MPVKLRETETRLKALKSTVARKAHVRICFFISGPDISISGPEKLSLGLRCILWPRDFFSGPEIHVWPRENISGPEKLSLAQTYYLWPRETNTGPEIVSLARSYP